MTPEDKLHAQRVCLFRRAQELGNVSAACREAGVFRSYEYRLPGRSVVAGPTACTPSGARGGSVARLPDRVASGAEAPAQPGWGPQPISD
jgi:hypothetical protein